MGFDILPLSAEFQAELQLINASMSLVWYRMKKYKVIKGYVYNSTERSPISKPTKNALLTIFHTVLFQLNLLLPVKCSASKEYRVDS